MHMNATPVYLNVGRKAQTHSLCVQGAGDLQQVQGRTWQVALQPPPVSPWSLSSASMILSSPSTSWCHCTRQHSWAPRYTLWRS